MDAALRSAYDAARDLSRNSFKAACYAPFVSMYFTTTGHVVACCKSQTLSVGSVADERLDAIWNGAKLAEFRRAALEYRLPVDCGLCEWQITGRDFDGVFARLFDGYGADEAATWPKVMEFAISNECNLECVMCTGESSSRIRARRDHLPPLANAYGDSFFEDLRKYLPHLALVKFLGGEPFLTPGNYRIWDMMIADRIATPCIVTTNGTQWDARVERVLDELPISIFFSMDGATKETLEAIRVGANFETLLANLRRFIDYTRGRGTTFRFMFSLVRANWREFGDFLAMAEEMGVGTNVCNVVYPPQYSLYSLPPAELLRIVGELERQDGALAPRLSLNLPTWRATLASLRSQATPEQTAIAPRVQGTAASLASYEAGEATDAFGRAVALQMKGRHAEALEEALRSKPTDVWHYLALVLAARLLREAGRLDESDAQSTRAIAVAPKRPEALVERCWLRLAQRRFDDGAADALAAGRSLTEVPLPDVEHELCCVAGVLFVLAGRFHEAEVAAHRLFELRPDDVLSHVRRGWIWNAAGRHAEAIADARAALARDPGHGEARALETVARSAAEASVDAKRPREDRRGATIPVRA